MPVDIRDWEKRLQIFEDSITDEEWEILYKIRNFQNGPDHPECGKLIPTVEECVSFGLLVKGEWNKETPGGNIEDQMAEILFENGLTAREYIEWHDRKYHDEYIRWHNETYS